MCSRDCSDRGFLPRETPLRPTTERLPDRGADRHSSTNGAALAASGRATRSAGRHRRGMAVCRTRGLLLPTWRIPRRRKYRSPSAERMDLAHRVRPAIRGTCRRGYERDGNHFCGTESDKISLLLGRLGCGPGQSSCHRLGVSSARTRTETLSPYRPRGMAAQAHARASRSTHPRTYHSDGCRTENRFRTKLPSGRTAEYSYVRYFFSNLSADIRQIFVEHCELLGFE